MFAQVALFKEFLELSSLEECDAWLPPERRVAALLLVQVEDAFNFLSVSNIMHIVQDRVL